MSGIHMHISDDDGDDIYRVQPDCTPTPPEHDTLPEVVSNNPLNFDGGFNIRELLRLLYSKVDKVHGKILTSNDFTDAYKNILDNITSGVSGFVLKTTKINNHPLSGDITLTSEDLGLGNVDNTADLDKPISTATQTALGNKQDKLTLGDLTEDVSSILDITGGSNAVIGPGIKIKVKRATESQPGYLSSEDFVTFKTGSGLVTHREVFIATANQTEITLQSTPGTNRELVNLNGLIAYPGTNFDYTITNNVITFNYPLGEEEEIMVTYT